MLTATKQVTFAFYCDSPQCGRKAAWTEVSFNAHLIYKHGYTIKDRKMVIADLKRDAQCSRN